MSGLKSIPRGCVASASGLVRVTEHATLQPQVARKAYASVAQSCTDVCMQPQPLPMRGRRGCEAFVHVACARVACDECRCLVEVLFSKKPMICTPTPPGVKQVAQSFECCTLFVPAVPRRASGWALGHVRHIACCRVAVLLHAIDKGSIGGGVRM